MQTSDQWWTLWIAVATVLGLAIGALVAWLVATVRAQHAREQLSVQVATLQAEKKAQEEKLQWATQQEEQMSNAFEALASRVLQTNAEGFLARAKDVVQPLGEKLAEFDKYVRELEQKREGAYGELGEQLRQLTVTHAELQRTTTTLGQALRSPTVRGQWGEIQLRRVVEMAGMARHIDFAEQTTTSGGRPDMVIHLPERGVIFVDAKVPLEAYLAAAEARDESERASRLKEHAQAMLSRVRELGKKEYWRSDDSPELVVMFVPNEACLGAAFECDQTLLEKAIEQRVLITTPVTLLALLKAIAYGWQQQQIAANARHVYDEGKNLYDRLATFVGHLSELGKSLHKTVEHFNKAIGSLEQKLIPYARHFEELGATSAVLAVPDQIEAQARSIASEDE
jgi:DNA recombination protein RmuC